MATQVLEEQTVRAQWEKSRRKYIGGSEVYELLNEPQYGKGCATALAFRKLGVEPDFPDEGADDALLERGNILEPLVAMLYEQETGRKVRRPPMDENGMPIPRIHPVYPWAGVNTDRLILTGPGGVQETGDLEIKTRGEGPFLRVMRQGAFPGDLLQPQWSTFVTNHSWGAIAILGVFGALPLKHYDVYPDQELHEIFKREGEEFANTVWGHERLPAPTLDKNDQRCKVCQWRMSCRGEAIDRAEAAALREITKSKKNLVQIEHNDLAATLAEMDLLKGERKVIEERLETAQTQALEMLGNTGAALVKGYGKAYRMEWRGTVVDADALKKDGLFEKYSIEKTGATYLRTYPEKIA